MKIQMENLKEMFEEVKEILIEGYSKRGKDNLANMINEFDVDLMISLVEPLIESQLALEKMKNDEQASL